MKANYTVKHECSYRGVASFDHVQHGVAFINRVCLGCRQHWYGPEGAVKEFSRQEWDAYVNS